MTFERKVEQKKVDDEKADDNTRVNLQKQKQKKIYKRWTGRTRGSN